MKDVNIIDFIDLPAMILITGRGESSIRLDVKLGRIAEPVKIGRNNYWRKSDVLAFLRDLLSDTEQQASDIRQRLISLQTEECQEAIKS